MVFGGGINGSWGERWGVYYGRGSSGWIGYLVSRRRLKKVLERL